MTARELKPGSRFAGEPWKPGQYCDRCANTGEINCRCGGDLCLCGAQEIECPRCHGRCLDEFYEEDDYYGEDL